MIVWSFRVHADRMHEVQAVVDKYHQLEHRDIKPAPCGDIEVHLNWHVEDEDHHRYRRAVNEILVIPGWNGGYFEVCNWPDEFDEKPSWLKRIKNKISKFFG